MYQWCEFKSRRGKNKNLTVLKSNSNIVWFNFQTYIYIYIYTFYCKQKMFKFYYNTWCLHYCTCIHSWLLRNYMCKYANSLSHWNIYNVHTQRTWWKFFLSLSLSLTLKIWNTKCMLNICCIAEHARGLEENFLKYVIKIGMHFLQNYKSQITWMDDHWMILHVQF